MIFRYQKSVGQILVVALAVSACGPKQTEEKQAVSTQKADAPHKKIKKEPASKSNDADGKLTGSQPVLKQKDIDKAKDQAAKFLQKHGPKMIADMALKNVVFFRENLANGRELAGQKKYDEAIEVFRKSLATKPNDARALVEIATAAFLKSDLATAEASALLGIGRAFDQQLKVRFSNLLDEISKKQGQPEIDPGLERIGSKLGAVGPTRDLDKLCGVLKKVLPKDASGITCDPTSATKIESSSKTLRLAAYLPVVSVTTEKHYILVVKTDVGWFAIAELSHVSGLRNFYAADDKLEINRFEFVQLIPGGPDELIIDFTHTVNDCDPDVNESEKHTRKTVMICGLKGKTPECMMRIPYFLDRKRVLISEDADKNIDPKEHTVKLPQEQSYALKVDLGKKGKVLIKEFSGQVPADKKNLIGMHTL
ncbi:MAG: tetratricopeptide repeat protein [Proteobacteria bacterium]|nr:tetratricopeptide repeat protein [Pseudomonadota bacterium]